VTLSDDEIPRALTGGKGFCVHQSWKARQRVRGGRREPGDLDYLACQDVKGREHRVCVETACRAMYNENNEARAIATPVMPHSSGVTCIQAR
jgi:hypothetical protein